MNRIRTALAFLAGILATGATAQVEQTRPPSSEPAQHGLALPPRLEQLERALARLEQEVETVSRAKIIDRGPDVGDALDDYADQLLLASRKAYAAAERDAERGMRGGGLAELKQFEGVIEPHGARLRKVVEVLARTSAAVENGDVMLSDELLRSLSPDERDELRRTLKPNALKKYKLGALGATPRDAAAAVAPPKDPAACLATANAVLRKGSITTEVIDAMHELLFPRAEAAVSAACYAICVETVGTACYSCVVAGGAVTYKLWTGMQDALRSCGSCSRWRPWRCACRAAVVVGFLSALA